MLDLRALALRTATEAHTATRGREPYDVPMTNPWSPAIDAATGGPTPATHAAVGGREPCAMPHASSLQEAPPLRETAPARVWALCAWGERGSDHHWHTRERALHVPERRDKGGSVLVRTESIVERVVMCSNGGGREMDVDKWEWHPNSPYIYNERVIGLRWAVYWATIFYNGPYSATACENKCTNTSKNITFLEMIFLRRPSP